MARLNSPPSNFADVLTISEAADFLGVSSATLRNWDRSGKLKPRRHPQNGYRIYLHEDLEAVLRSADLSTLTDESFAPQFDWTKLGDSEHLVQFYENDEFLIESVGGFIGVTLRDGGCSVVVATPEHRTALEKNLRACGIDLTQGESSGRYIALDARETLSRFMLGNTVSPKLLDEVIGGTLAQLKKGGRRVHAFGEMVALLWADGNRQGAIELEQAWSRMAVQHQFAIFCAYPIAGFNGNELMDGLQDVCSCHSQVIPAESYSAADSDDKRMRAITLLQQRAQSLEAEIEHRHEVEKALLESDRRNDEFLATLSHELRDRLSPIRNSLDLLAGNSMDEATRIEVQSCIKRQLEQMIQLVDDLLDLGRNSRKP